MTSVDFFATTTDDAQALLALAELDWSREIPHCPGWDAADLVGHLGGIFAWMATIVTTGRPVARADREVPPVDLAERASWYLAHLEQALDVLSRTTPDTEVWTFSSRGVNNVGWWRRRLAVETAIHRWDAEFAVNATARQLDGEVAAAGIEEFVDEFLPGLLAQPTVTGLNGMLHFEATDNQRRWDVDLDALRASTDGPVRAHGTGEVIRGTVSDLLLWLTNRESSSGISGQSDIAARWNQLRR
jgi:uncharacterized protein (TIGR03083 family)